MPVNWYDDRANLALMAWHMVASGADAMEIARAIEKPWCYHDEYVLAEADLQFPITDG